MIAIDSTRNFIRVSIKFNEIDERDAIFGIAIKMLILKKEIERNNKNEDYNNIFSIIEENLKPFFSFYHIQ